MNKSTLYALLGFLALILISWAMLAIRFPYMIHTKAIAYANIEWSVTRTPQGDFITVLKDNRTGQVSSRNISQYIKGDEARFVLSPSLEKATSIRVGDTVGVIQSEEESLRLMTLQGELEIQMATLKLYASSEKPAVIGEARKRVDMARADLHIQKKNFEKVKAMATDSLVSAYELELAGNQVTVKELGVELAEAAYQAVLSGEKNEQLGVTRARIRSIEEQIRILKKRQSGFTIQSPISGMIIKRKNLLSENSIALSVIDTNGFVAFTPVPLVEAPWINQHCEIRLRLPRASRTISGIVHSVDNSVQIINGKQSIFITGAFPVMTGEIMPGEVTRAVVYCDKVNTWEFMNRIVQYFIN